MSDHPLPPSSANKSAKKSTLKERARNALITGTAGGYLGGMLVEGTTRVKVPNLTRRLLRMKRKTVGIHGARTGALIGAAVGARNKGGRSETADAIGTGGDWKFSAFIEDMTFGSLPKDVQADVTRFVDAKKGTPLVHYGMSVTELVMKADGENLKAARKAQGTTRASRAREEVMGKIKAGSKYILLMNDRIVDGHHFLAKAERGAVTSSLNVLDLTPARLSTGGAMDCGCQMADRSKLTQFAEEKKKSGWKRKAAIAAGTAAGAVLGARTLPRLIRRGRALKEGEELTGKVLYTHEGLTTPLSVVNIGGKNLRRRLEKHAVTKRSKLAAAALKADDFLGIPQRHYGVGAGGGRVIEKTKAHGHRMVDKEKFARGNRLHVDSDTLPKDESKWGKWAEGMEKRNADAAGRAKRGDLCLIGNNCEHHAREIAGQGKKSYQSRAIVAGAAAGAATGAAGSERITRKKEKKFARLGGRLIVFETPVEKRNRVRDLRDKIGLAKDVGGLGAVTAAGVGSVKGYRLLKKKVNDPEVRKLVKHGQVLLRTWNKAGKATAQGAKNMSDVAAPGAALVRGGKAMGKAVVEPFLKAGRVVRTWLHHDPRPVLAFASKKDRERNQRDAKIVGGSTAAGALVGANHIGGRRVKEGEKLQAGVRYVRRHGKIPLVQHEGIGTGQARIAEVAHDGVRLRGDATTHITDRKTFAKGMPLYAIDEKEDLKAALRARQGAKQVMGKKQPFDYCLKGNNCQHWTEAARTGVKPRFSRQMRNIGKGALLAGGLTTAGIAALRARKEPKKTGRKKHEFMVGALMPAIAGTLGGAYAGSKLRSKAYRAIRKKYGPGKWATRVARLGALATENGLGVAGGALGSYAGSKLVKQPKAEFARLGGRLIQFGGNEQIADLQSGRFKDPFGSWLRKEKGYRKRDVTDYHGLRRKLESAVRGDRKFTPETVARMKSDMQDIAANKGVDASHGQVIGSVMRKADTVQRWGTRGGGLVKDAVRAAKGEAREKDAWGRTKKREWEKPWFERRRNQVLAAGAIGLAGYGLRKSPKAMKAVDGAKQKFKDTVNSRFPDTFPDEAKAAAAAKQSKAAATLKHAGEEAKRIAAEAAAARATGKVDAQKGPEIPGLKVVKEKKPRTKGKSVPYGETKMARIGGRLITLADPLDVGWDIRDARGRSARVFAPEAGQRDRRPKRWHERVENERKLWGAAALTGTLTGAAATRKLLQGTVTAAVKAERGKIRVALQKARKLRAERQPKNIHVLKPEQRAGTQPPRPGAAA